MQLALCRNYGHNHSTFTHKILFLPLPKDMGELNQTSRLHKRQQWTLVVLHGALPVFVERTPITCQHRRELRLALCPARASLGAIQKQQV